jgi:hypothetical protein
MFERNDDVWLCTSGLLELSPELLRDAVRSTSSTQPSQPARKCLFRPLRSKDKSQRTFIHPTSPGFPVMRNLVSRASVETPARP